MAMTEKQVEQVIAAKSGDTESFMELYAAYRDKVYALVRMTVKNPGDAGDILRDTFVTAWRKLSALETPSTFSVWIQIIAGNLCDMYIRKKALSILLDAERGIEDFDITGSEEYFPAAYAKREDLKARFGGIIESLSEVQRQAVTHYYFNELSVEEIADVASCSVSTVKTRLFLAKKAIIAETEEFERKSGERSYGIPETELLPLGELICAHMGSLTMDQNAAIASQDAVTAVIQARRDDR